MNFFFSFLGFSKVSKLLNLKCKGNMDATIMWMRVNCYFSKTKAAEINGMGTLLEKLMGPSDQLRINKDPKKNLPCCG